MSATPKYKDVRFFLIAIAFISAFNYYLTYTNIRFNWFLIITYTIDTVQGWLAWWAVRSIVIYLDTKMPYGHPPIKRIIVQILLTTITGLFIIIVLTEIVSWIARGRPALPNFYSFDILIFIIWFLVLNGIYIGMHYYHELKGSEERREEEKRVRTSGFPIKQGKQNLMIPFEEILGFYTEDGVTVLLNHHNKKFITEKSLDKIEQQLPEELFFRLNRQFLFHRDIISGFRRTSDGKLDVQIRKADRLPDIVQVSRLRAVPFKKWFQPEES